MLSLISQASRQHFVHQSYSAYVRNQVGLPRVIPRVFIRDQRLSQLVRPDVKSLVELETKVKEKKILPMKIRVAKTMPSTSTILPPSKIIYISQEELQKMDARRFFEGHRLQFPVGARGKDRYVCGQVKVQTRQPGDGPFTHVKKGAYDVRGLKYLYVINQDGVHIKRELSYASSNRGIVCHPKIAPYGFLGGEVWFLPDTEGKTVHINLNSGRFPAQSDEDLITTAKVWLSLGYDKVYVTPRDQRYGEVTPLLFKKQAESEVNSSAFV